MSQWKIIITPEAGKAINDIYYYIAGSLHSPDTAKNQIRRIINVMESLDDLPLRFPLYQDEPWRSRGLRFVSVDNYLMFYLPNEKNKEVVVLHVLYGGRNINNLLL